MNEYHLTPYTVEVEKYLEKCLLIEITEVDDYRQTGNSRRCGWPDLPMGWAWPRSKDGKYLNFLSQINLNEIAIYQDALPRYGMLYFFIGGENFEPEGQILYFDGDLSLLRKCMLPEPLDTEKFSLGFRPDFDENYFLLHHYPRKLNFHSALSIPDIGSRLLEDKTGVNLAQKLSYQERGDYSAVKNKLMNGFDIEQDFSKSNYDYSSIHQRIFGYESCQTFDPREFGKSDCKGPQIGIELYCIWDHDEVFQTCLDGTIMFVVRQDELNHCHFSDIFVAIEG